MKIINFRYILAFIVSLVAIPAVAVDQSDSYVHGELIVLLNHGANIPTPQQLVDLSNAQLALPGVFGDIPPISIKFLDKYRVSVVSDPSHPKFDTPHNRFARYLILRFPPVIHVGIAELILRNHPWIRHVGKNYLLEFSTTPTDYLFTDHSTNNDFTMYQWGSHVLGLTEAWDYQKGHSYIGVPDNGVQVDHPDLRAFDGTEFVGGNFRPYHSMDFYVPGACDVSPETCVDEAAPGGFFAQGHGTAVAGLIAATPNNDTEAGANTITGTCWNCSLFVSRITKNWDGLAQGVDWSKDNGAQVVSVSLGGQTDCSDSQLLHLCTAISAAADRDIIIVAASGNNKEDVNYPASDNAAIAVGGIEPYGDFWDFEDDPGGCPNPDNKECGSNYTITPGSARQDVVAPAVDVLSAFYTQGVWTPCVDVNVAPAGWGFEHCTGTSFSAPYVAGILGLIRSTNPLLSSSDTYSLLVKNADRANSWDNQFGYGVPDAGESVKSALGQSGNGIVPNRLTPLFSMYSSGREDHLYTTVPQMGAIYNQEVSENTPLFYLNEGTDIATYGYFPDAECSEAPCFPEPGASVYVFTSDRPVNGNIVVPLYRMSYEGENPPGCTGSPPVCNESNYDHAYTTNKSDGADIEAFKAVGYRIDGIEGYIYPNTISQPPHTVRLYRKYNPTKDDHAIFPESQLSDMIAAGYTDDSGDSWIGWVYPNTDSDQDSLIDGFEIVLGTNPAQRNSDCDVLEDGVEYPLTGIPSSDPLVPVYSPGSIVLANDIMTGTQTEEACDWIIAGPSYTVMGNLTLRAGKWIDLRSGFSVAAGGVLSAKAGE